MTEKTFTCYTPEEQAIRERIKAICSEISASKEYDIDPELSILVNTIELTKKWHFNEIEDLNLSPAYMITEVFRLFTESRTPKIRKMVLDDRIDALRTIERIVSNMKAAHEPGGHA